MALRVSNRILIWLQGTGRRDATISIWKNNNLYYALFNDPELTGEQFNKHKFTSYIQLYEYLDLFFDNLMIDEDDESPFEYVQWDIPGFTSSIIKLDNMEDRHIFRTFCSCLEFYFDFK